MIIQVNTAQRVIGKVNHLLSIMSQRFRQTRIYGMTVKTSHQKIKIYDLFSFCVLVCIVNLVCLVYD